MGFNTHSILKLFPCQKSCTQISYRPSMSLAELTCSRSSNNWLSSCEGARANIGPFSVQNFARLLSYIILHGLCFLSPLVSLVVVTPPRREHKSELQYYAVFYLQASAACDIQLRKIPALCTELIKHWKAILDFMMKTAPTQVLQGVENKVSIPLVFYSGFIPNWSLVFQVLSGTGIACISFLLVILSFLFSHKN